MTNHAHNLDVKIVMLDWDNIWIVVELVERVFLLYLLYHGITIVKMGLGKYYYLLLPHQLD